MVEESLVGRDQAEGEGRQARIDRLFAEAVERQMVEQRSFNRVIEEVGERLASLESGMHSLSETTASQGRALRAELQDGLTNVANLDGGVGSRLEELAGRLEQRLETLGQRLGALEMRVGSQEEAVDQATSEIFGRMAAGFETAEQRRAHGAAEIAQALQSAVSERIQAVEARLDERFAGLGYGIDERLAEVVSVLVEGVGEQVDGARAAIDESRYALAGEIVNLSSRLREAVVTVGESAARDAAESRDAATAVADNLLEFSSRLAKIEEHFPTVLQAPERTAAVTIEAFKPFLADFRSELVHEQREELTASLGQVRALASGVAEEIEELQILAAALRQAQTEDEERLVALRDDLLSRAEGLLTSGLGDIRNTVDRWVGSAEEEGRELRSMVEERLDAALTRLQERVGHMIGTVEERLPEVLSGHREELLGTLGQFEARVAERLGGVEEGGRELLASIDERLRESEREGRTLRAAIEERLQKAEDEGKALRSAMEERLEDAVATMRQRLEEMVATVDERVPEVLSGHREDLQRTLEKLDATVAERLRASEEEGRALLQALDERLGRSEQEGRALRAAVDERLEQAVSTLEDRLVQVGVALDERLPELLAAHEHQAATNLKTALEVASERLDAADDAFRTALGTLDDLAPDLDDRIARALERAVETARREARSSLGELHAAAARLADMQATFAGLERSLADYLTAFDARLERERARILSKLGEELAEGLSRRERRRLVDRLRGHQEPGDLRPQRPEDVDAIPPSGPWRVGAREMTTGREVASQGPGTAAKPPGGWEVSGTAAKPPGGWEVSGTAAKPPGGLEVSGTAAKPPGGWEVSGTAAKPPGGLE
ncbi:MAG: hypothetical protein ABR592_14000, partial [Nitriliruptorales bacterium]